MPVKEQSRGEVLLQILEEWAGEQGVAVDGCHVLVRTREDGSRVFGVGIEGRRQTGELVRNAVIAARHECNDIEALLEEVRTASRTRNWGAPDVMRRA